MLVVLAVSASLVSCELLGIADNPVSPRLKVKASSMTVKVGDTKKCPVSASTKAKLLYASSDETIATVDANGLVTGVKEGDAVITVVATNQEGSDLFLEESAIVTVKVVNEAVALLEDAKEEKASVSITYTLNGTEKTALFKRVGDDYVLQSSVDGSGIVPYLTPIANDEQEEASGEGESDGEDIFENLDSDVEEDWNFDDIEDDPDAANIDWDDDDEGDDDEGDVDDGDIDDDDWADAEVGDDDGDADDDADAGARAWTRADGEADDDEVGKDLLFGLTIKATDVDILQTQFNTATGTYTEVQADDSDADGNTAAFVGLKVNGKQVAVNPQRSLTRAGNKVEILIKTITLSKSKYKLKKDKKFILQATLRPINATNKNVKWTSSSSKIANAKKDKNGTNIKKCKVTGLEKGKATITCQATKGNKKKTCKVEVYVPVAGVQIQPKGGITLTVGQTYTLKASISPSDASNKKVTFKSDNPGVATVTSKGKVTAKKAGTAKITVTTDDGKKTRTCTITVTDKPKVQLSKTSLNLTVGDSETLTATVSPAGSNQTVTWASSDTSVATVKDGLVTAVKAGKATITCTATNGTSDTSDDVKATCEVTVKDDVIAVTGVSLSQKTLSLKVGSSATLTATVAPTDATDQAVTWSSDKESVATIFAGTDGKATIYAEGAGEATITVTTNDGSKTATCVVTVTDTDPDIAVTGVTLDQETLILDTGGTATLTATIAPEDATDQTVTWSSDKESVATVDKNGKITAVAAGEATITVKTNDGGFTATCKVTVLDANSATIDVTMGEEDL